MKTKCPFCQSKFKIPDAYEGRRVKCSVCRKEYIAVGPATNENVVTPKIKPSSKLSFLWFHEKYPIFLVLLFLGQVFFIEDPPPLGLLNYLFLSLSLLGCSVLIARFVNHRKQIFPKLTRTGLLLISLLCIWYYAKNDTYTERIQEDNGTLIINTHKFWAFPSLIYQWISIRGEYLNMTAEGPCATRKGSYQTERHGMWNFSSWGQSTNYFKQEYRWYWYGDEITEGEWISRKK